MLDSKGLRGVIPAIVTPFRADGKLDEEGLERLTGFVIQGGVHAIMTTGGTGEFVHLSREERKTVVARVVRAAKGRVPVIAGTAACSTDETIAHTRDAAEAGADASIVVSPYYFRIPDRMLFEHFKAVAEAVDLPLVVYNNPLYTGHNLPPEMIARLMEVDRIIGLKQSQADLGQLVDVLCRVGSRSSILTGIDSQFYPALCAGATGIFSTAACVVPSQMVQVYDLYMAGRHQEALAQHLSLQPLNAFFEYDPGYVAPCKEALAYMGLPGGPVRRPLPDLTADERRGLFAALADLGIQRASVKGD